MSTESKESVRTLGELRRVLGSLSRELECGRISEIEVVGADLMVAAVRECVKRNLSVIDIHEVSGRPDVFVMEIENRFGDKCK